MRVRNDWRVADIGLVLDCSDPEALAKFWGPALGYATVGGAGAYVLLMPPGPDQPKLLLQRVPEGSRSRIGCISTSTLPTSTPKPSGSSPLALVGSATKSYRSTRLVGT